MARGCGTLRTPTRWRERLADAVSGLPGARLLAPVEANGVFVDLPRSGDRRRVRAKGWRFYKFVGDTGVRLMCAWDTTAATVDAFAADLRAALRS